MHESVLLPENFYNKDDLSCHSRLCIWSYFHTLYSISYPILEPICTQSTISPSQSASFPCLLTNYLSLSPLLQHHSFPASSLFEIKQLSPKQKMRSLGSIYSRCTHLKVLKVSTFFFFFLFSSFLHPGSLESSPSKY